MEGERGAYLSSILNVSLSKTQCKIISSQKENSSGKYFPNLPDKKLLYFPFSSATAIKWPHAV